VLYTTLLAAGTQPLVVSFPPPDQRPLQENLLAQTLHIHEARWPSHRLRVLKQLDGIVPGQCVGHTVPTKALLVQMNRTEELARPDRTVAGRRRQPARRQPA
jgi:hypothetical protein